MLQLFICAAIAAVTTGMSFGSSIGPSHTISEIATSHVFRFKKTRNKGHQKPRVFLIKRVRAQCHKFWVSNGWVVAVRSKIMKYIKNRCKSFHFTVPSKISNIYSFGVCGSYLAHSLAININIYFWTEDKILYNCLYI